MRDHKYFQQLEQLIQHAIEVAQRSGWGKPAGIPKAVPEPYLGKIQSMSRWLHIQQWNPWQQQQQQGHYVIAASIPQCESYHDPYFHKRWGHPCSLIAIPSPDGWKIGSICHDEPCELGLATLDAWEYGYDEEWDINYWNKLPNLPLSPKS